MVSQPPPTGVCLVFESGRPATGGAAGDGDRTAHGRFGQTVQIGVATELLAQHFALTAAGPARRHSYLSRLGLLWRLPKSGQTRL